MATLRLSEPVVRTTTAEALLGMLSLGPMSGYEIRRAIDGSIGNFWQESYGQIYPTLKRLVAEGLAAAKEDGGKGRTVYRLTAAGRKRLRAWVATPSKRQVPRNELLLKVFFAGQGARGVVEAQVEEFRRLHEGELARLGRIRDRLLREQGGHPDQPYWLMTLDYGMAESEAMLAWCGRTLGAVKRLEEVRDAG